MEKTDHSKDDDGVKNVANDKNLKQHVNDELERIGSGGPWVWYGKLFDSLFSSCNKI